MINIKENKGITLVSLVITVIILLILTGTTIYNFSLSNETSYYNKMISDIKLLSDKILVYYNKYAEIPKTVRQITVDGIVYYEIDLEKLDNLTLNYGDDYNGTEELTTFSDVYAINEKLDIYYLKGVEKSGEIHHSK